MKKEDEDYIDKAIAMKRGAYKYSGSNNYNFYRVWHSRYTGSEFKNRATHIGYQAVLSKDG